MIRTLGAVVGRLPLANRVTGLGKTQDADHESSESGSDTLYVDRDAVVQQYLDEQNAKFDLLINRNIGAVMENDPWLRVVDILEDKSTVGALVGHAQNYLQGHKQKKNEPDPRIEEMVAALSHDEKIALLREIKADLGMADDTDFARLGRLWAQLKTQESKFIDKLELLVIVLIRLGFLSMRYLIPLSTHFYHKFCGNEVLLFNSRNFNRLMLYVISLMETLEEKLNDDKLQLYQYGSEPKEHEEPELTEKEPQLWKAWAAGYALRHYMGSPKLDYTSDPAYSQYFARTSSERSSAMSSQEQLNVFSVAQRFADQMA